MAKKAIVKTPSKSAKSATTLKQVLKQLESLGNEATRKQTAKWAYGGIQPGATQFGVKHGDIRALAKTIGPDHALALSLWDTRNVDAQLLAVLLVKPQDLSAEDVDRMVRSITSGGWRTGCSTTSSSSTPTRKPCGRGGWPTATAGPPAPDGN